MKKLLSTIAVSALLTTGAFAAENQIIISGDIQAGAFVAFGAAPTGTLLGGTFTFEEATLAFGTMTLGSSNTVTNAVHVNTNSQTGVSMAITGNPLTSTETGSSETIATTYTFGGTAVADATAFSLTTTTNDGSTTLGDFVATAAPTASQESGAYATTLTVSIVAL